MNCKEFEDLMGAYAIGALPEDERGAADAHAASCAKHPDVATLRAVADSLALAPPLMDPPARLRSRLLDLIHAESAEAAVTPKSSSPPAPRRGPGAVFSAWLGNARLGYGIAAALGVVVAALLLWNISLQGGGDSNTLVVDLKGQASGQLIYLKGERLAVMDLDGLGTLPSDKVYEVWAISSGNATALGVVTPTNGRVSATLPFDATGYDTIAITIEPAPGGDQPTSQPIISGEF